jgi:ArsR family metal-binding transcriptional regulator
MFKEDVDYRFVDMEDSEITSIELLMENYVGVKYYYHKARVIEDNGIARLQFGYTVYDSGKHDIDVLNSNEEFRTIMGEILSIILMSKAKEDESFRNNNTEKLNLQ